MKTLILAIMISLSVSGSVHDFKIESIDGKALDLAAYKGKKILIVNTASACGYTPQYAELEKLYQQYKNTLVVIGFPANNFGNQEPGSNEDIQDFCQKNYGVTFPLSSKVSVKGDDIHPLFSHLIKESASLGNPDPIKWNFSKFLVDENGKLIQTFSHKIKPLSDDITSHLN